MNRTGHYKLARQSGGIGLFAEVWVTISDQASSRPAVADGAFDWLKEVYGADAREWPPFRLAALRGAEFALAHAATPPLKASVTIETIRTAPADTTAACVAYAACRAVWDALGDPGDGSVQILGRDIFFVGRRLAPTMGLESDAQSVPQL